jgi:hypothetical protein
LNNSRIHRLVLALTFLAGLISCQTLHDKDLAIVRDRIDRLQPLSKWHSTQCRVLSELTEPARARYKQMFPGEADLFEEKAWVYLWVSRESGCEIRSPTSSPLRAQHRKMIDTAFCVLLQTHYVNSPFDDLQVNAESVSRRADRLQILSGSSPELGIFLDPEKFEVETRTRSRGIFVADYAEHGSKEVWVRERWLPSRLELKTESTTLVLDAFDYGPMAIYGRTLLQGFNISIGEKQAVLHTHIRISGCTTPSI